MKKVLLWLSSVVLSSQIASAANPVTGYVQLNPPNGTQAGGPNTQTSNVTVSQTLPYIGGGIQCVRSVNGVLTGTGQDCGAGAVASGSNTIVASPQYQIPFYSQTGTSNTLTGASGFSWYGSSAQVTGTLVSSGPIYINSGQGLFFRDVLNEVGNTADIGLNPFYLSELDIQPPSALTINGNQGDVRNTAEFILHKNGSVNSSYATFAISDNNTPFGHYSGFSSTSGVTTDTIWSLPRADGTSGQCLVTDGAAHLSFAAASGGGSGNGTVSASQQFNVAYYTNAGSTTTVGGNSHFTTDGSSIAVSSIAFNGSGNSLVFTPFTGSSATFTGPVHMGNFYNTNVASTTPLAVISRDPYPISPDNAMQAIYGEYNGAITGTTSDFNGVRGNFFNTDNSNVLADANGVGGFAVDVFPGKNATLNGGQFFVQGRGYAPNYIGIYDRVLWTSTPPAVTTTTSAITGLFVGVQISSGDFTTPLITSGPVYSIYINPKLGGGASGRSYALLSYDTDPSFLSGSLNVNGGLQTGTSYYQFNTQLSVVNATPNVTGYDAVFSTSVFYNNGNAAVTISSNAAIAVQSTDNTPFALYRAAQSSPTLQLLDYFDYLGDLQLTTTGAVLNLAGNFQQGYGGMDLQNVSSTSNTFTRGMVSSNLIWSNTSGNWFSAGNGGNDYAAMLFRQSGDIAFASSANQLPSTNFSDASVKSHTHLYINATSGDVGIGMGATSPSNAQFQVLASTTNIYSFYASTAVTGGFGVDISTNGHFNIFNSSSTQGPTIANGTGDASCSDVRCTVTASASPVTFTFSKPFAKVPVCTVTPQTGSITNTFSYSKTVSAITITETAISGLVDIICIGGD